ncbi:MAG: hypothetical protein AMXMBFR84_15090 [Candidatus Hydrogenedentota bacterium]
MRIAEQSQVSRVCIHSALLCFIAANCAAESKHPDGYVFYAETFDFGHVAAETTAVHMEPATRAKLIIQVPWDPNHASRVYKSTIEVTALIDGKTERTQLEAYGLYND